MGRASPMQHPKIARAIDGATESSMNAQDLIENNFPRCIARGDFNRPVWVGSLLRIGLKSPLAEPLKLFGARCGITGQNPIIKSENV